MAVPAQYNWLLCVGDLRSNYYGLWTVTRIDRAKRMQASDRRYLADCDVISAVFRHHFVQFIFTERANRNNSRGYGYYVNVFSFFKALIGHSAFVAERSCAIQICLLNNNDNNTKFVNRSVVTRRYISELLFFENLIFLQKNPLLKDAKIRI